MELTTLPGQATEASQTGSLETLVIIAGDELHTPQASSHQALKEGAPVDFMLAESS
jgi:hypothetical protein